MKTFPKKTIVIIFVIALTTTCCFLCNSSAVSSENISDTETEKEREWKVIALKEHFFDHLCRYSLLWHGSGCPDEFDSKSIPEGPEKEELYEKGVKIFEKEARNGTLRHQQVLAHYFYSINKDMKQALYWANKSAEQGCDLGMMILCTAYLNGDGVLADMSESIKWLLLAKTAGNERAKKTISELEEENPDYHKVDYVTTGKERAIQWIKNHPEVFFNSDR